MDDVAVPIIPASPELLIPQLRAVFQCAYSPFSKFRFKLNFKNGKSNAIARFACPGSDPVRAQLQADAYAISCRCGDHSFSVFIVDAYQHLGRILAPDLSLKPDIVARGMQCKAALAPTAHRYLREPSTPLLQKIQATRPTSSPSCV